MLYKNNSLYPCPRPIEPSIFVKHFRLFSVHSPLFSRKIVEIERYALGVAILDECQDYLGGGGRFGREHFSPPPPRATCIIPDALPLGAFENQDGSH